MARLRKTSLRFPLLFTSGAWCSLLALAGCAGVLGVDELTKTDCVVGGCDETSADASASVPPSTTPVAPPSPGPTQSDASHGRGGSSVVDASTVPSPEPDDAAPAMDAAPVVDAAPDVSADAAVPPRLFTGIADNFDDNSLSSTLWNRWTEPGTSLYERNQQLEIVLGSQASYAGVVSQAAFDARGKETMVEVKQVAGPGSNVETYLQLNDSTAQNYLWIDESAGSLEFFKRINGTTTRIASARYDSAAMRWWRIREASGSSYAEYAAGRNGPWVALGQAPNPFAMTAVEIELGAGAWEPTPSPAAAIFDNLNR